MSLDYKGIPEFSRDRDLYLASIDPNQVSSFVEKNTPVSEADLRFDELAKTYLKGNALQNAIKNLNPGGFIPVEPESSVVVSIQRQYPKNENYNVITFGMFQEATEFLSSRSMALNEDNIISFKAIDPKIENSVTVSIQKGSTSHGKDWISCFLDQLSSWAGMLIAGKMIDLSMAVSPQVDVDSNGGTGGMKSWSAQGFPIAIAILVELGLTLYEYNRLYKNDPSIPPEVHDKFQELSQDPVKRQAVLQEAGISYTTLRDNQKFNDLKAIRQYAIAYIDRNQDTLDFTHWLSYAQVVQSQTILRGTMAMAPTFSSKWNKFYNGPSAGTTQDTTVTEDVETVNYPSYAANVALTQYLADITIAMDNQYNDIYQSLTFDVDPQLICCLAWILGPMDTTFLSSLSGLLALGSIHMNMNLKDSIEYLGETILLGYVNMLIHYICMVMDSILRSVMQSFGYVPPGDLAAGISACVGFGLILDIIDFVLRFIISYMGELFNWLRTLVDRLSQKTITMSENIPGQKALLTLSRFLGVLANDIDRAQSLCPPLHEHPSQYNPETNKDLADQVYNFAVNIMPGLYPVLEMPEIDRRKYFSDIPAKKLKLFNLEVPGTDSTGMMTVYSYTKVTECGSENNAVSNIEIGNRIAQYLRGTNESL